MAGTKHCMECGEKVPLNYKTCPYCGFNYAKFMKGFSMPALKKAINKKGKFLYSDEEKLALGLYPKDKNYKMSLISRILGKK